MVSLSLFLSSFLPLSFSLSLFLQQGKYVGYYSPIWQMRKLKAETTEARSDRPVGGDSAAA